MSKSEQKTVKIDEKEQKIMDFDKFVMYDLTIVGRALNIIHIIAQDLYLFLNRLAEKEGPEREKIKTLLDKIIAENGGDVMKVEEGLMNRQKDKAIREMVIYEEMRQYTNQLKELQAAKK
jgi:hypothetical protein